VEINKNVPIDNQNVPEGHRGLHDFLYGSDDEHTATETTPQNLDNEAGVMPRGEWCEQAANAKVAGVYAVLDSDRHTQYIGYSRNVRLTLEGHVAQNGESTCAFVRVKVFKFPKRTEMEALRDQWLAELDSLPPGNADNSGMWASTVGEASRAVMSDAERNAYEEKKLKLRKAMADTALSKETDTADAGDAQRRQQLDAAVNNDDWSAVINHQSQQ
jgi:hypothetical protein